MFNKVIPFSIRIASIIFAYAIVILVSNGHGISVYGIYSYHLAFVYLYSAALRFGFDVLVLRYNDDKTIEEQVLPMFYFVNVLEGFLSIGIWWFSNIPWSILIASHLFSIAFIFSEIARRKDETSTYILFTNTLFLVFQFFGFLLFDIAYLVEIVSTSFLLNLLLLTAYLVVKHKSRLVMIPKVPKGQVIRDAGNSILITLTNMMDNHGTIYILSFFTTTEMLGVFSISRRISNGVGLPYQVLNMVNAPKFLQKWSNQAAFQKYLKEQMRQFFVMGFIMPLTVIPAIFIVPHFVNISEELLFTFYVISIIFILAKAIDGLTGPSQTLIRLFGSLKQAANAQTVIYLGMGTMLFSLGVLSRYTNLNVVIAASLLIAVSLTLINIVFVYLLKQEKGIDLIAAFPDSWMDKVEDKSR